MPESESLTRSQPKKSESLSLSQSESEPKSEVIRMKTLRQAVSELMVAVHKIPRELADHHTSQMDEVDLAWRFEYYMRNYELRDWKFRKLPPASTCGSRLER